MNGLHFRLKKTGTRSLAALTLALLPALLLPQKLVAAEHPPSPERQAVLRALLHQECGSCHGLYLTGGLGPALTPDALKGQTKEQIALTIMQGRPGTAMPPWNRFLQPPESQWLADFLLHASDTAP